MGKGAAWLYRAPRGGESEGPPASESREPGESADPPEPAGHASHRPAPPAIPSPEPGNPPAPAKPVGTEGVRGAQPWRAIVRAAWASLLSQLMSEPEITSYCLPARWLYGCKNIS